MKHLIVFLFIFSGLHLFSQSMEAFYDLKKFNFTADKPYIDVYISFNSLSVIYDSTRTANVESILIVKKGKKIVDFRKSLIKNTLSPDGQIHNFFDIERFSLTNGKYVLQIMLRDLNLTEIDTLKAELPFVLSFSDFKVELSDIELIESMEKSDTLDLLTKAGYRIIPYVNNYFPPEIKKISFYAEIYNTNKSFGLDEKFVVVVQLIDDGGNVIGSYRKIMVKKAKPVNIVLNSFNIEKLYSGNYSVNIEVRDEKNELVTSKSLPFYRNNPLSTKEYSEKDSVFLVDANKVFTNYIINRDTIIEYIKSMRPRADLTEQAIIDNQLESATIGDLQQFMYVFWSKRNEKKPELTWDKYHSLVLFVNAKYGTQIKKGYITDRGRVTLQYGKPNKSISISSEPSAYPYEIWFYYHIGTYNNKRFVFYNSDLSSNDYELLHSDMRGERFNSRWSDVIYSRAKSVVDFRPEGAIQDVGRNAEDYYNNPR